MQCGAVAEWSKALAWKVSIRQKRIEGSNPSRSATQSADIGKIGEPAEKRREFARFLSGSVVRRSHHAAEFPNPATHSPMAASRLPNSLQSLKTVVVLACYHRCPRIDYFFVSSHSSICTGEISHIT